MLGTFQESEGVLTLLSAWLQKDMIILYDMHKVFAVDALATSHPLSRPEEEVNDPAQISEMFNTISYSKVCSTDTIQCLMSDQANAVLIQTLIVPENVILILFDLFIKRIIKHNTT